MSELKQKAAFLKALFGNTEGILCLAAKRGQVEFIETFFEYPKEVGRAAEWANRHKGKYDIYFSPMLYDRQKRQKEFVIITPCVWADLDTADPSMIRPPPTIVVNSSSKRTQAYWLLEENVVPLVAENISKRIAYAYKGSGVDTSGWDLTQLLRIPGTINHKREEKVDIAYVKEARTYQVPDFANIPDAPGTSLIEGLSSIPEQIDDMSPNILLDKYRNKLSSKVYKMIYQKPLKEIGRAHV